MCSPDIALRRSNIIVTTTDYAPTPRFMLDELVANTQYISAPPPPDDWDLEAPAPLPKRCLDGGFILGSNPVRHRDGCGTKCYQDVKPISMSDGAVDDVSDLSWLQGIIHWLYACFFNREG